MQILNVTAEQIKEAVAKYSAIQRQLSKWLHDPLREITFADKLLAKLREVVGVYKVMLTSPRFSVEQLETFGYKKTAEGILPNKYLRNVRILRNSLSDSEILRWRGYYEHYFPVPPFLMPLILQDIDWVADIFRPDQTHISIVPAMLFSDLFWNDDILAFRYGGIWAYLTNTLVDKWRLECTTYRDWDITLRNAFDYINGTCTVIEDGKKRNTTFLFARTGKWLELTLELIFQAFQEEKKNQETGNRLRYKTLIGLEKYTEEQLLYLKLTRHQCTGILQDSTREIKNGNPDLMNTGFLRSPSFRKVWNCPKGSNLHSPVSCLIPE